MNFITINEKNVDREHICCAISDKKGEHCVSSKKDWLKERFTHGLVFRKLDARGKVFIEYIPGEHAWCPIDAEGYMHINCFWVSGQFKGQGYASQLLAQCIEDARSQGKLGLTVLSSPKKLPFLSDPKYLKSKGFLVADAAPPFFQLLYLPFEKDVTVAPRFRDCVKSGKIDDPGLVLYYSNQCPHTYKYAPILAEIAGRHGVTVSLRKIEGEEQAQNAPSPATTYSLYYNGTFVTHEILSEKKIESFLEKKGL